MSIPCTLCNSEFKEFAESLILNGESNNAIADTLRAKGLNISHASINRHKNKHMPDYKDQIDNLAIPKNNTKYDRNDINCIDAKAIYDEIKLQSTIPSYSDIAEYYNMLNIMLLRIVNNQMAITIDLQEKYMQGLTKYPHEQIRGLQVLQDLLQKFELFSKDMFKHKSAIIMHGNTAQYISDKGYNAKCTTPKYEKGDMFKIMVETGSLETGYFEYHKKYMPVNPYEMGRIENHIDSYSEYDKGIQRGIGKYERNDIELYFDGLVYIKDKDFLNKVLKILSKGRYNYDNVWDMINNHFDEIDVENDKDSENESD